MTVLFVLLWLFTGLATVALIITGIILLILKKRSNYIWISSAITTFLCLMFLVLIGITNMNQQNQPITSNTRESTNDQSQSETISDTPRSSTDDYEPTETSEEVTEESTQEQSSEEMSTEKEAVEESTVEEATEEQTEEQAKEDANKTANVGETLTVDGVDFTVNEWYQQNTVGEVFSSTANDTYLILDVTVTNNQDEALSMMNSFFNILIGESTYEPDGPASTTANQAISPDNLGLLGEELNPGSSRDALIVYDVIQEVIDNSEKQLQVQSGIFGTQTGLINLN